MAYLRLGIVLATLAALGGALPAGAAAEPPLRPLMRDLSRQATVIVDGLMREDYPAIARGAQAIATHPEIPASEVARLKRVLGDRFEDFERLDGQTHAAAAELARAARSKDLRPSLRAWQKVERGCVNCHVATREAVRGKSTP